MTTTVAGMTTNARPIFLNVPGNSELQYAPEFPYTQQFLEFLRNSGISNKTAISGFSGHSGEPGKKQFADFLKEF